MAQQLVRRAALVAVVLPLLLMGLSCGDDGDAAGPDPSVTGSPRETSAATASTVAPVDPATLECPVTDAEARAALAAGVDVLRRLEMPRADTVWALREVAERHPELGVTDPLGGRPRDEPGDPAWRLVDPNAAPGRLPRDGDSPGDRFIADMSSAFLPEEEARTEIDRVTALPDLDAYALTHQWLQLIWADDLGIELPARVAARSGELEARVRAEVGHRPETLDLWAERTGLLAMYGSTPIGEPERSQWICRAVRTQHRDGYWEPDGTFEQRYAGGTDLESPGPVHLTAVMTLLLAGLVPPA